MQKYKQSIGEEKRINIILIEAIKLIEAELKSAYSKFPPFKSSHEGYAVILEELDELWDEIKNDKKPGSQQRQKDEAIQVAAMAIKFINDLC